MATCIPRVDGLSTDPQVWGIIGTDFTIGIFSQNLVTQSNFVGFLDNQNFTFLEAPGVASNTWHLFEWLI